MTDETPKHPAYSTSKGTGIWKAEVKIFTRGKAVKNPTRVYADWSARVALLKRANMDVRTDNVGLRTLILGTSLPDGATDFEHDRASGARIEISLAQVTYDYGEQRSWVGVLTDFRMYPEGVNPLEASDGDTDPGWCGPNLSGYGPDHKRHRFAPYLPPERDEARDLIGKVAVVEMYIDRKWIEDLDD